MPNLTPHPTKPLHQTLGCDQGTVVTIELVMVSAVVLVGLIVAFSSVRDSVVSELVDTSLAVQSTNQSLAYYGTIGTSSVTAGANWNDASDANHGNDVSGTVVGTDFDAAPHNESSLEDFLESKTFQMRMTRGGATWTGTGTFADGVYTGTPYWPGVYTIEGEIITVVLNSLNGGWDDGTIVLDASNRSYINGPLTWINSISGFVWEAIYELF